MSDSAVPLDGRRARRDRNRHLVVDAYLDLVREGVWQPSVAEVAERSGVSHRSVFRYFADRDELVRTAIEHQHRIARPAAALSVRPRDDFDERLGAYVDMKLRLFEVLGPVARLARSLALTEPLVGDELRRVRAALREQLEWLFSTELDAMEPATRATALAGADALCSFETVSLLVDDQGLTRKAAAIVVTDGLRAFLGRARD